MLGQNGLLFSQISVCARDNTAGYLAEKLFRRYFGGEQVSSDSIVHCSTTLSLLLRVAPNEYSVLYKLQSPSRKSELNVKN